MAINVVNSLNINITTMGHWSTSRYVAYLDLQFETDNEVLLRKKLYDKRDNFNLPILNFSSICSNIPAAPANRVDVSQLIRYSRACGSYQNFLDVGRHHDLVNRYGISVSQMITDMIHLPVLSSFMTYHRLCN